MSSWSDKVEASVNAAEKRVFELLLKLLVVKTVKTDNNGVEYLSL